MGSRVGGEALGGVIAGRRRCAPPDTQAAERGSRRPPCILRHAVEAYRQALHDPAIALALPVPNLVGVC